MEEPKSKGKTSTQNERKHQERNPLMNIEASTDNNNNETTTTNEKKEKEEKENEENIVK